MRSIGMLAAACLLAACARLHPVPTMPTDDAAFDAPRPVVPPGLPDDAPQPETVLPGDVLKIRMLSLAPLELEHVRVDATGAVYLPVVGAVQVGGLAMEEARARIEEAMRPLDRLGKVVLTLADPQGHRVTVAGAVRAPGSYLLRAGARVAEVVAQAGGPERQLVEGESIDVADVDAARVVRDGQALPISVGRALEGDPLHNVRLQPGDLVVVPASRGERIAVLGDVQNAKTLPYRRGLRLSDALALAGGAAPGADLADIRVVRGPLSKPRIYKASLAALTSGRTTDVLLAPGDVVFVTRSTFYSATEVLQRLAPLLWGLSIGAALAN